ncbi:hypothetical protein HAX54_052199 [Datura stramonium]|uniref:Uncharacterized protein n=1 Tax=Datura stramonium TaxID=4076 RepID=A0ABS8WN91_DATST|nr:hypothetical protein [Datura stramonium]
MARLIGKLKFQGTLGWVCEYDMERTKDRSVTAKFTQERVMTRPRRVLKGEMGPDQKLLFELVNKCFLP